MYTVHSDDVVVKKVSRCSLFGSVFRPSLHPSETIFCRTGTKRHSRTLDLDTDLHRGSPSESLPESTGRTSGTPTVRGLLYTEMTNRKIKTCLSPLITTTTTRIFGCVVLSKGLLLLLLLLLLPLWCAHIYHNKIVYLSLTHTK